MFKLFIADIKMIVRDRQILFWALVFPLIFVVVFGLFDPARGPSGTQIAVFDNSDSILSRGIKEQVKTIEFLEIDDSHTTIASARQAVQAGELEFLLLLPSELGGITLLMDEVALELLYDEAQATSLVNQLVIGALDQLVSQINMRVNGVSAVVKLDPQGVRAKHIKYFDVLLMGLVGMGVMFNSILVLAVTISTYRQQKVLRRLLVTPLRVRNFFIAIVLAYLLLALVQAAVIMGVGVLLFDGTIYGNLLFIFIIVAAGDIIFLNLGFIISAYSRSPAAASGMGNVVALPMMFFSGTFFPIEFLPSVLPQIVQVLPLTPLLDLLRAISLDEVTPWQAPTALLSLGGWILGSSLVAIKVFKFN